MEVLNEIKQILLDKNSITDICKNLESQQNVTTQKLYFFRVLDIIKQFDDLMENKIFEDNYINHIKIFVGYHPVFGGNLRVKFYDRECEDFSAYVTDELQEFSLCFEKFEGFDIEDTGPGLIDGFAAIVLDKKYRDKLYNVFFSKELKDVLDTTKNYLALQEELINPNKKTNKKLKV